MSCTHCGYTRTGRPGVPVRWSLVIHTRMSPRCERCGRALQKVVTSAPAFHDGRATATVRCPGCSYVGHYPVWAIPSATEDGCDPIFGLPLLLTAIVDGELLWAFNLDHVEVLENYLGASLRERPAHGDNMTMMAKLPRWMKEARNREKMLNGLARLRSIATEAGVA